MQHRHEGLSRENQRQNHSTFAPIHTMQSPVTMQDKTLAEEEENYPSDVLVLHGCQGADEIPLEEAHSSLGSQCLCCLDLQENQINS